MVGVLSRKYPHRIPELMGYQSLIIKCSRDFEGLAWAQYDRAYRRQAAQSKDLKWSRLNPTLYSLCFAGKARKNIACCHCLSDMHTSETCMENPARALLPWPAPGGVFPQQQPMSNFVPNTPAMWMGNTGPSAAQMFGSRPNTQAGAGSSYGGKTRVCHLFNAKDGPRCNYSPCKFTHICAVCKGGHPRSACSGIAGGKQRAGPKRPRED